MTSGLGIALSSYEPFKSVNHNTWDQEQEKEECYYKVSTKLLQLRDELTIAKCLRYQDIWAHQCSYGTSYRHNLSACSLSTSHLPTKCQVTEQLGHIRSTCDALSRPCSRLTSALSAWMLCTRCSATSLLLLVVPLPSTAIAWELRGDDGPDTGWSSFCCSILCFDT